MHQFAKLKDGIFTSTPTKTPHANPIDETHIYNKIKRTTIWADSAGEGGGGSGSLCRVRIFNFQSFAGDNIFFHPTSAKPIYFKIKPI